MTTKDYPKAKKFKVTKLKKKTQNMRSQPNLIIRSNNVSSEISSNESNGVQSDYCIS